MKYAEKEIYSAKGDPRYAHPYIDCKEEQTRPDPSGEQVPYLYVHGGFEGTSIKFMFCFPPAKSYEGRFYMHLSPFPGPDEETAAINKTGEEDFIAFAVTHGAAYVESNMGSAQIFTNLPDSRDTYRNSAAVAEYCRDYAQELFGPHRCYGYVFGGSGGGYKTMSCIENTDAFDGAVPFVIGSPVSLPNCLTVYVNGKRQLRHCWQKIMAAQEPGGSGDIYEGLLPEEKDALHEVVSIGVPPRMLSDFGNPDDGALPVLLPGVKQMDPEYFTDFWNKEGYEGTDPASSFCRDRICMRTSVVSAGFVAAGVRVQAHDDRNGTDDAFRKMIGDASGGWIEAQEVPQGNDLYFGGCEVRILSGRAAGKVLHLGGVEGKQLLLGAGFGIDDYKQILGLLESGDEILIDNSDYLAVQAYHRHQIPDDPTFLAWDQYKNSDGTPKLPQRPLICYVYTAGGCGSVQDGKVQCRTIVMNNLMDGDFPWQADWYRRKIEEVYGKEQAHELFRVYYNDNAPHGDADEAGDLLRIVSYLGMLRQALLDLAAWVEKDEAPAEHTGYDLIDNQIILKESAAERGGLQPKVTVLAEGARYTRAKAGEPVTFTMTVEAAASAGRFESADWAFEGDKTYPDRGGQVSISEEAGVQTAVITKTHVFEKPGTYYCSGRAVTNRSAGDAFTRLRNLDRVRVDVE